MGRVRRQRRADARRWPSSFWLSGFQVVGQRAIQPPADQFKSKIAKFLPTTTPDMLPARPSAYQS